METDKKESDQFEILTPNHLTCKAFIECDVTAASIVTAANYAPVQATTFLPEGSYLGEIPVLCDNWKVRDVNNEQIALDEAFMQFIALDKSFGEKMDSRNDKKEEFQQAVSYTDFIPCAALRPTKSDALKSDTKADSKLDGFEEVKQNKQSNPKSEKDANRSIK